MNKKLLRTLLATAMLVVGANAWAYDTPDGYGVSKVFIGTAGSADANGIVTTVNINDFESLEAVPTGWAAGENVTLSVGNVTEITDLTVDQSGPSYVANKCIGVGVNKRDWTYYYATYDFGAVSSGYLVFNGDFFANDNNSAYLRFADQDGNNVFSFYPKSGSNGQTFRYQIGDESETATTTQTKPRIYKGWRIRDMVINLSTGALTFKMTYIAYASSGTSESTASYSYNIGTGKNIAKLMIGTCSNNENKTKYAYLDNVSLYSLDTYADLYTAAKAEYDTKAANLDAAGQTYWSNNVIPASSVTTAASYSTAIAALPTTYVSAVKAQTTPGSDMTAAMNTEISASSWTNATNTYKGVAVERYNGDTPYSTGKTLYQTVSGLHAGYYKVKFYGVANVARNLDSQYYGANIAQIYANDETLDIDVIYQDACSPISDSYLREFEVYLPTDDSSIEFGIKNIAEGGQWYVAQALSLNYLGTEKIAYTINAVAGETTISQLASGTEWASNTYGTYIPYVISYNNKYYVLDDDDNANLDGYYASYTMGASAETKGINYTLDESIVAFFEGENMTYWGHSFFNSDSNIKAASSGKAVTVYSGTSNGIRTNSKIEKGIYNISVAGVSWGSSNSSFKLQYSTDLTNWTDVNEISFNASTNNVQTVSNVTIPEASYLRLMNNYNSTPRHYTDYVLVDKVGEVKTISAAGWATYCSPYALDFSDAIDNLDAAYIVTGGNDGTLTKEAVTGTVAANTGLLLKGSEGTLAIPVAASGTDYSSTNKLIGVTAETEIAADAGYVLMNDETNGLGFYKNANAFTLGANTAYLPANFDSNTINVRGYSLFDGEVTGIESIATEDNFFNGAIYNLAGQRVNNGYKGIVIKNGKKYLVK